MWPNRLTPSLDRCTKEISSSPPNSTLWPPDPRKRGPSSADRNRIALPLTPDTYDYERHSQIAGPSPSRPRMAVPRSSAVSRARVRFAAPCWC